MKVKTSVALDKNLIREIDHLRQDSRSEFITRAVEVAVKTEKKRRLDMKEIEKINRHAKKLNREAAETLAFQKVK